jgi:hypothetical protein
VRAAPNIVARRTFSSDLDVYRRCAMFRALDFAEPHLIEPLSANPAAS